MQPAAGGARRSGRMAWTTTPPGLLAANGSSSPLAVAVRRIAAQSDFCGSPKCSSGSPRVTAYCMSEEGTRPYRARPARPGFPVAGPTVEGETRLVAIDIARGALAGLPAGPGIKVSPGFLP